MGQIEVHHLAKGFCQQIRARIKRATSGFNLGLNLVSWIASSADIYIYIFGFDLVFDCLREARHLTPCPIYDISGGYLIFFWQCSSECSTLHLHPALSSLQLKLYALYDFGFGSVRFIQFSSVRFGGWLRFWFWFFGLSVWLRCNCNFDGGLEARHNWPKLTKDYSIPPVAPQASSRQKKKKKLNPVLDSFASFVCFGDLSRVFDITYLCLHYWAKEDDDYDVGEKRRK